MPADEDLKEERRMSTRQRHGIGSGDQAKDETQERANQKMNSAEAIAQRNWETK